MRSWLKFLARFTRVPLVNFLVFLVFAQALNDVTLPFCFFFQINPRSALCREGKACFEQFKVSESSSQGSFFTSTMSSDDWFLRNPRGGENGHRRRNQKSVSSSLELLTSLLFLDLDTVDWHWKWVFVFGFALLVRLVSVASGQEPRDQSSSRREIQIDLGSLRSPFRQ